LDAFQVRGIVAGFWNQSKYDFLTLMARGSRGVVDAWRTSIVTALEEKTSKDSPLEHKLVKLLMGSFVAEIAELEAKKAELESQIKAASPDKKEGEDGEEAAEDAETDEQPVVSDEQLKAWKKDLSALKKKLKDKNDSLTAELNKAVDGLTPEQAATLLLTLLHNDMLAILERYMTSQRQQIVAMFENWWDKYKVTLTEIETERDAAARQLGVFLKELGYV
jgi:type I restriction enzyme M protein